MSRFALIDCDNFFVSCERVFRPDIWHRPVAVLSNNDGCIVARSSEVKMAGVPMGAPLFKVRDILPPGTVLFSANFALYGNISQRIVGVLQSITPLVEVYSIDECFLDLSQLDIEDIDSWAVNLRRSILRQIGVPVSIGVGPTKTLAKVATKAAKKINNGIFIAESEVDRDRLLDKLPIEDVWGIGRRMSPKLKDKGISFASQLVRAEDSWIKSRFNITGIRMIDELRGQVRLSFGDNSDQRKSIMRSRAFGKRLYAMADLEPAIATFAASCAAKLRSQGSVASGLVVYLVAATSASGHKTLSTAIKFPEMTADTSDIITAAVRGAESIYSADFGYKKAGVILLDIVDQSAWQLALVGGRSDLDRRLNLMTAVDEINQRFGSKTVWHATENLGNTSWKSKQSLRSPEYTTKLSDIPILAS